MKRTRIIAGVLLLLVAGMGCSTGSEQESMTVTEKMRLTLHPKVGMFLIEGQRAYERGAYQLALAYTDSAESFAPRLADVHFLRGMLYTQLNQLEVARAAYETVLELDPAYKGARYNMGINAFRRGKLRDAIDLFQAEKELEATSKLYLEVGQAYAKLGEPDSARMAYEQAIALDSTNATAFMWLGQLYEELGELDEALKYSREGLRQRPDNLDYRYIIGSLLFRTEQIEEAADYLQPVAEERPSHHGAQYNMGQVLMRLGREDEAQAYFARADSAQQLQQQVNDAEKAINLEPEKLENWTNLGQLLRKAGHLDKAVEAYKVAISLDPWNLYVQNNLAILMMENGDMDGAIRRYRAILGLDSTLAEVWLNLGVAYANTGRTAEARRAWQNTLKHEPGHRGARAFLARLREQ